MPSSLSLLYQGGGHSIIRKNGFDIYLETANKRQKTTFCDSETNYFES